MTMYSYVASFDTMSIRWNVISKTPTRIVLASDYTITREGLRFLFTKAPDIEIIGEAQPIMATPRKVCELAPDVVLIEVSVPGRADGLWAAATIAHQSPKSRVVVLTNNNDLPYVRSMLGVGVVGYVLKNCETTQLFAALRSVRLGGRFIDPSLGTDFAWHSKTG